MADTLTPFGKELRNMRAAKGLSQKQMAQALAVSPAYLSALERGKRGKPSWAMVQRIIGFFNVIWDDADKLQKLADLSDPKVSIDTANLSSEATRLANLLSQAIGSIDEDKIEQLIQLIERSSQNTSHNKT